MADVARQNEKLEQERKQTLYAKQAEAEHRMQILNEEKRKEAEEKRLKQE